MERSAFDARQQGETERSRERSQQERDSRERVRPSGQTPTAGRIVNFILSKSDAAGITAKRRTHNAAQADEGTPVAAGDCFPMLITKVKGVALVEQRTPEGELERVERVQVSGQVFLEGNDVWWVKATTEGKGEGFWAWPTRD